MANRNMEKLSKEYLKLIDEAEKGKRPLDVRSYSFYSGELDQLIQLSGDTHSHIDPWKLLWTTLNAGFMAGYKAAYKEMQSQTKG